MGIKNQKIEILDNTEWLYNYYITQNFSHRDIAKMVNCHPSTIARALKKNGIKKYTKKLNKELKCAPQEYLQYDWMYNQFITQNKRVAQIAQENNTSICNVERHLKRLGIKKPIHMALKLSWDTVGRVSNEEIYEEAKKYTTRGEFQRKSASKYRLASIRGILNNACKHMSYRRKYRTNKELHQEALRYKTRVEFQKKSKAAYGVACRRGILDNVCSHMIPQLQHWSDEDLKIEASKYKTRKEFQTKNSSAYQVARRRKLLNNICSHMKITCIPRSKESLINDALKYKTRKEMIVKDNKAYRSIIAKGLKKEAFAHMQRHGDVSFYEMELLKSIQEKYPSAEKISHSGIKIGNLKIKRFEIDIYIPDLKKGIEFDGKYWHGNGFSRSWTQDPKEYHQIKDNYFLSQGIEILHIKEEDWLKNKQYCIDKCFDFLSK